MRNPVVDLQLNNLRVNEKEPDLLRRVLIEKTHNQRVDTYGLSGTCRTCNQEMRHLLDIRDDRLSLDIPSDGKCKTSPAGAELLCLKEFSERDCLRFLVRNLDTNGSLSRDRCLDTDLRRLKRKLNVILKVDNPAHLDSGSRLQLIARNGRSDAVTVPGRSDLNAEFRQCLHELMFHLPGMLRRIASPCILSGCQQIKWGKCSPGFVPADFGC